jgi:hypothetical protein
VQQGAALLVQALAQVPVAVPQEPVVVQLVQLAQVAEPMV